jgi:hypothetical protein
MATTSPPSPRASPVEAAQQAVDYARRQLFPFRFDRWLALGFVAFLDQCGRGGGGGGGSFTPPGNFGGSDRIPTLPGFPALPSNVVENLTLIVAVAAIVLAAMVALVALVLWINSRGIFMYIDNVATGRSDVARPWSEHKEEAGSFFAWRFGLAVATLAGVLLIAGLCALGYFSVQRGALASGLALALTLLVLLPLLLILVIGAALLSVALRDFVAPIQFLKKISCGDALSEFGTVFRANMGSFLGYLLLKIAFAIALAIVATVIGCMTCCLGFLPVVAQTILQPAFYFERAWSLYLLRGFGYDVLREDGPLAEPRPGRFAPPPPWSPLPQ